MVPMVAPTPVSERIDPANPPEYLRAAVEHLRAAFGDKLVGVALYGSRARGEARPDSDVDLLVIARDLPPDSRDRARVFYEALRGVSAEFDFSVYGRTPEEFEKYFPSVYLDMGLDAIVLYDTEGYLTRRLARIREIISQVGLVRERIADGEYFWDWKRPIGYPWELDWEGLREGPRRF